MAANFPSTPFDWRDRIVIKDLEVDARVGVTEDEQEHPQKILITVEMELDLSLAGHTDQEAATTDYLMVANMVRRTVAERPRKLLEAIAHDIAEIILGHRLALQVTVEVKKFTIPRSQYVSVILTRKQT